MPTAPWKTSITVAAIVEREGRYLLVEEHTPEGVRLNNPAGHLDPGETPLQAVVRETLEETTCRFTPSALVGVYLSRAQGAEPASDVTYLRLAFAGDVSEPLPGHTLDTDIVRTLWLTPEDLRACSERHRSPLLMRCVDDHRAGRRFPLDLLFSDPSVVESLAAASAIGERDTATKHADAPGAVMTQATIAQKAPYPVNVEAGKEYWWCRCGNSKNQPFCDGSHKRGPFTPLKYTAAEATTVYFCGCKQSGKKPLCDGTHKSL